MISESDHAEPFTAFCNGIHQFLYQHFLGAVIGQVQLIEAGVSAWEAVLLELAVDVEALHSAHASQIFESLNRDTRTACYELDEGRPQLHVECLQHFKQPYDDGVVSHVVYKVSVATQILDIDSRSS